MDAKANDNAWEWLKSALSGRALGRYTLTIGRPTILPRHAVADEPSPAADEPSQDRLLESLRFFDDMLRSFEPGCKPSSERNPS